MPEVRCPSCGFKNKFGRYRLSAQITCGNRDCRERLPEPHLIKAGRVLYRHPRGSCFVVGTWVIVAGYVAMDSFNPYRGIIGNAVSGRVWGIPYSIIFALGLLLVLVGAANSVAAGARSPKIADDARS